MRKLRTYKVVFLGRTGNGKTSLINAMYNTKFDTNSVSSCTKELYTVTISNEGPQGKEGVTVYDTPGIGEYSSNSIYQRYYEHAASVADCIVLVLTFDKTDAQAQRLLMEIKPFLDPRKKVRFIIALNHIDSRIVATKGENYTPWDEVLNEPSEKCHSFINEKIEVIHQKFDNRFLSFEVVPVCAKRLYGLEQLKQVIIKK